MAPTDDIDEGLARVFRGLRQRALLHTDPVGRRVLDERLLATLQQAIEKCTPHSRAPLDQPPPRRVAVAFALSLFGQPHLRRTLGFDASEPVLVRSATLEQALGLSRWELEELQEDTDRRASLVLRQITLGRWLLSRYPPARLYELLFPAARSIDPQFRMTGATLSVTVEAPAVPVAALHLPWVLPAGVGPLDAFRGRSLDDNLPFAVARGVGILEEDVHEVLEGCLSWSPRHSAEALARVDLWRRSGFATFTGVSASTTRHGWLKHQVTLQGIDGKTWLPACHRGEEDPGAVFDRLLQPRLNSMMLALYEGVLAHRLAGDALRGEELDLYDVSTHVAAVAAPLLDWVLSQDAIFAAAAVLELHRDEAAEVLAGVAAAWLERVNAWTMPNNPVESPLGGMLRRLLVLSGALQRDGQRELLGLPHRDLLYLFAGHFLAESTESAAPLTPRDDPASPGKITAIWFWPVWDRLIELMDNTVDESMPEFVLPDEVR